MTPEEFAIRASKMGYATKKTALAYAKGKDCLTDSDYEELYRQWASEIDDFSIAVTKYHFGE